MCCVLLLLLDSILCTVLYIRAGRRSSAYADGSACVRRTSPRPALPRLALSLSPRRPGPSGVTVRAGHTHFRVTAYRVTAFTTRFLSLLAWACCCTCVRTSARRVFRRGPSKVVEECRRVEIFPRRQPAAKQADGRAAASEMRYARVFLGPLLCPRRRTGWRAGRGRGANTLPCLSPSRQDPPWAARQESKQPTALSDRDTRPRSQHTMGGGRHGDNGIRIKKEQPRGRHGGCERECETGCERKRKKEKSDGAHARTSTLTLPLARSLARSAYGLDI